MEKFKQMYERKYKREPAKLQLSTTLVPLGPDWVPEPVVVRRVLRYLERAQARHDAGETDNGTDRFNPFLSEDDDIPTC